MVSPPGASPFSPIQAKYIRRASPKTPIRFAGGDNPGEAGKPPANGLKKKLIHLWRDLKKKS